MKKNKFLIGILLVLPLQSGAGLLFSYARLALKDLDQMNQLVQDKIKESRKSGGDKTIPLKEALQAVYSRPNNDVMLEKVIPPLKDELELRNGWQRSIKALVKEAVGALKNPKAFKLEAQMTYLFFLENILTDLKPYAEKEFEGGIIRQIKDAKIEVSRQLSNEKDVRMLKVTLSPSQLAETILTPPSPVKEGDDKSSL